MAFKSPAQAKAYFASQKGTKVPGMNPPDMSPMDQTVAQPKLAQPSPLDKEIKATPMPKESLATRFQGIRSYMSRKAR